jgi:ElaB/YqjD/DUF883 family membrane-anchored ribosome-binding protein
MAEPLSNPDKINRDYLAGDPERELPEANVPELMDPERELRSSGYEDSEYERSDYERYEATSRRQNPRLNDTAEAIGNAVGNAARRVQEMKDRFTVISGRTRASASSTAYDWKQATDEKMQEARERATQAFEEVRLKAEEVRLKANDTLQDAKDRASRVLEDVRQNAADKLNRARFTANRFADQRPLHIILGIGAAAFVVGVLLRVGRSNNA